MSDDYPPGYDSRPSNNYGPLRPIESGPSQPNWARRHPGRTATYVIFALMLVGGLSVGHGLSLLIWIFLIVGGYKATKWLIAVAVLGRNTESEQRLREEQWRNQWRQ